MAKERVVLRTDDDRRRAIAWIEAAEDESRLDLMGPQRTNPQNRKMWAMIGDIVKQKKTINGREFSDEDWKVIFLQALGKEQKVLPTLDGDDFFPSGYSSSKLEKKEMSDLIEFMFAWGAENNVVWSDPETRSLAAMMR